MHAFERTGTESAELHALGGPFVRRMREVGWCSEHACSFDDEALRAMFRLAWNGLLHLERPPFAPTTDEQRALYAFYLRHPHAPETPRKRIDEARASARTERACAALVEAEAIAAEGWRIEKVKRLALARSGVPGGDYALGVAPLPEQGLRGGGGFVSRLAAGAPGRAVDAPRAELLEGGAGRRRRID